MPDELSYQHTIKVIKPLIKDYFKLSYDKYKCKNFIKQRIYFRDEGRN